MASHGRNRIDERAGIATELLLDDIVLLVVDEIADFGRELLGARQWWQLVSAPDPHRNHHDLAPER